jgi:hypothetical protein
LTAILQKGDMGSYIAVILGVGSALGPWCNRFPWVFAVLSAIVSWKLPSVLREQVSKYLGRNGWLLLQFGDLIKQMPYPLKGLFSADFDVDTDSFLASVDYRG